MTYARDGFTLLEVVVAIALLSAITVAAVPLLVDATRAGVPPVAAVEAIELGALADQVMRDEVKVARILDGSQIPLSWKDAPSRRPVVARRLRASTTCDGGLPHDWIEFRCGDTCVLRYRRIVEKSPDEAEPPP
jgi:prepilin-type N-terminal cleavage/methylation domain-containing protein